MRRSLSLLAFLLVPLALTLSALLPTVRAVSPPPDGGDFHGNTAEGDGALNSAFNTVTGGWYNTALGYQALLRNGGTAGQLTTASHNTATGAFALNNNTTGFQNTASGVNALYSNNADNNTANGFNALYWNTTGSNNTANGVEALYSNDGDNNTATGSQALYSNGGDNNTATGSQALYNNNADNNTANGFQALYHNYTGSNNTANGAFALTSNSTGSGNTATGWNTLQANSTGGFNAASGNYALYSNTTGYSNVATGVDALYHNQVGHDNTAEGYLALLNNTGSNNIALGSGAGLSLTTGGNNIDIGAPGVAGEAKKIRIGKQGTQIAAFIAGIYNVNEGGTIKPLYINGNGQLGTQAPASARRFKNEIKPMDQTSEAILGLKPVTFQYKSGSEKTPQFGLIAEEVAKVNPDLVVRDENGQIYTVRYEAVNAMLLNEFLKEHRKVQQLEANALEQQKEIKALAATVKNQASQIQKVSVELELSKPAPQTVANNQGEFRRQRPRLQQGGDATLYSP